MRLPHLLGYSRNAVELTLALALIVHLLTVLAAHALGLLRRTPTLRARLGWLLGQLTVSQLTRADPPAVQLPLPGWGLPLRVPP